MFTYDRISAHDRRTLLSDISSAITTGGSRDYGVFSVDQYSRLTGMFSTVGSLTFRTRLAISSGTYQVSSNFAANSGSSVFDAPNYGRYAEFVITAANSTLYSAIIFGEPLR